MEQRTWRKFSREHILQQKDPWEVARNAFEIALELAVLGQTPGATTLHELFQSFAAESKSTWSPGLYFAWEATGLWPESIPPAQRTPEALKKLEVERIVWKRDTTATDEGLDSLIVQAIGNGDKDAWGHKHLRADDLTAALDLAVYMGRTEKALHIIQIFAENFDRTWEDLSKSRLAWRLLKDGAMSMAIDIDGERLNQFQAEVLETFKERLEKGPRRTLKDIPMKELVEMCNQNTLKNAVWEEMDVDPAEPPETVLHKGATPDELADLEKRLNHSLPQDYKEFLSVTNGMESLWNGYHGEPRLLGTAEVHMFDATKQQKVMTEASVNIGFYMNMSIKPEYEPLSRVVQLNDGTDDTKFVWFILPEDIKTFAAAFFSVVAQLPPEEQQHVKTMMGHFYAGVEDPSQLDWIVTVWSPPTLELSNFHSWREYVEVLAAETANEDILDEVDREGRLLHSREVFAYQLRKQGK